MCRVDLFIGLIFYITLNIHIGSCIFEKRLDGRTDGRTDGRATVSDTLDASRYVNWQAERYRIDTGSERYAWPATWQRPPAGLHSTPSGAA